MILAINIGNSNLRFGVFDGDECKKRWLIQSRPHKSADEYDVIIHSLMREHKIKPADIDRIFCASVVPALTGVFREALSSLFGFEPVFIDYRMNSGLSFPIEKPVQLGADLLSNAAAAFNLYRKDVIVVDFGTAMSFTVVRADGMLSGIVIAPGVVSALGSLVEDTAQLPSIELVPPERVIGIDTIGCIQSGIIYGYCGLIDNIVNKIDQEQKTESTVIATGGTAHIFENICDSIDIYDDLHTLKGLQILSRLNPQ